MLRFAPALLHYGVAVVGVWLLGAASPPLRAAYEITGYYDSYYSDGVPETNTDRVQFVVGVNGCQWRIEISDRAAPDYHWTSVFDGTVLRQLARPVAGRDPQPQDPSLIRSQAIIADSPFVPFYAEGYQLCWTAFASQCVLKDSPRQLPPVWSFDHLQQIADGYTMPVRLRLEAAPPHLPLELIYVDPAIVGTNRFGRLRTWDAYPRGFTNVIYHVDTWTNIGGDTVPWRFWLKRLLPRQEGLRLVVRLEGAVTGARLVSEVSVAPPALSGRTQVLDLRSAIESRRGMIANYHATNWLSVAEVRALVATGQVHPVPVNPAPVAASNPRTPRRPMLLLLLVLNGGALLAIGWALRRRSKAGAAPPPTPASP